MFGPEADPQYYQNQNQHQNIPSFQNSNSNFAHFFDFFDPFNPTQSQAVFAPQKRLTGSNFRW